MNEDPGKTKFSNSLEATSQDYASKKDKSSIDRGPEEGARWAFGVAEGVRGLPPCDRVGDGASGEDDMPRGRGKGRGGGNDGFEAGADRVVGDGNAEDGEEPPPAGGGGGARMFNPRAEFPATGCEGGGGGGSGKIGVVGRALVALPIDEAGDAVELRAGGEMVMRGAGAATRAFAALAAADKGGWAAGAVVGANRVAT